MDESEKCECHDLVLPRWDIYTCPYCKRQLASIEDLPHDENGFLI